MKRNPPKGNVRRVQPIDGNFRYTITNKTGQTQQCESHLERKLALLLHRDKQVKDYCSQPETAHFIDAEGGKHRYTPDFKVWIVNGSIQIHEVTVPERRAQKPYLVARESFARSLCSARGWQYYVHTPETLPNDTETANLLAFYAFRAAACCNAAARESVLRVLHEKHKVLLTMLIDQAFAELQPLGVPKPTIYVTVFHLIWHDEIQILSLIHI